MNRYPKYFLLAILVIGLVACGDDSTGPDIDPGDPPELPDIQSVEAQPDVSFFEDNAPKMADIIIKAKGDTANYYKGRTWVLLNYSVFMISDFYGGFLMAGSYEDAEFEDGVWVWEYSYSYENERISLKLTAEEVAEGYKWILYWSWDDGEISIEDYKMMEGIVSDDGNSGEWTFNAIDEQTSEERVAYTSEWEITSETEKTMLVKWYDESGNKILTADYVEDQPEYYMTYSYSDEPDVTVYWNTDTKEGYYEEEGGDKLCWNEHFKDIPCS